VSLKGEVGLGYDRHFQDPFLQYWGMWFSSVIVQMLGLRGDRFPVVELEANVEPASINLSRALQFREGFSCLRPMIHYRSARRIPIRETSLI